MTTKTRAQCASTPTPENAALAAQFAQLGYQLLRFTSLIDDAPPQLVARSTDGTDQRAFASMDEARDFLARQVKERGAKTFTAIAFKSGGHTPCGIHISEEAVVQKGYASAGEAWQAVHALMHQRPDLISGTVREEGGVQ